MKAGLGHMKKFPTMSDNPAIRYQKEIISNYTGIPDFGSESFSKMTKQNAGIICTFVYSFKRFNGENLPGYCNDLKRQGYS